MEAIDQWRRRIYLVVLSGALGVIAALVKLPWHIYAVSVKGAGSFRLDRSGLQSPEEAWGRVTLAVAAALAVGTGYFLLRARAGEPFPPARSDPLVATGAVAVGLLLVMRLALNTDFLGSGAWVATGLGLAVGVAGISLRPRMK